MYSFSPRYPSITIQVTEGINNPFALAGEIARTLRDSVSREASAHFLAEFESAPSIGTVEAICEEWVSICY